MRLFVEQWTQIDREALADPLIVCVASWKSNFELRYKNIWESMRFSPNSREFLRSVIWEAGGSVIIAKNWVEFSNTQEFCSAHIVVIWTASVKRSWNEESMWALSKAFLSAILSIAIPRVPSFSNPWVTDIAPALDHARIIDYSIRSISRNSMQVSVLEQLLWHLDNEKQHSVVRKAQLLSLTPCFS